MAAAGKLLAKIELGASWLLLAVLVAMGGYGFRLWYVQHHEIWGYTPTTVAISSATVEFIGTSTPGVFKPNIAYSYTVNGKTYTSNRVYSLELPLSTYHTDPFEANFFVQYYFPRTEHKGYVNPKDPTDSYLIAVVRFPPYVGLLGGFLVLAGITATVVKWLRQRRRGPAGVNAPPSLGDGWATASFFAILIVGAALTSADYVLSTGRKYAMRGIVVPAGFVMVVALMWWLRSYIVAWKAARKTQAELPDFIVDRKSIGG